MKRPLGMLQELVAPVAIVALWWWLSADSTSVYLPPLRSIASTFAETWDPSGLRDVLVPTLVTFFAGFGIATVLGIALGVALAANRAVADFLNPVMEFLRALPGIALVPAFISVLGIGMDMRLGVVVFASIWPVLLNTIDGVRGIDGVVRDSAAVFGVPRLHRLGLVTLPGASPQIFAGMRVGLALSLVAVIVTEMVVSAEGVGAFARAAQYGFDVPEMWAAILLMGIVGYALNKSFDLIEKGILRWHFRMRELTS
jgi:ABC-type nitrate/sulfonate/bicarbonate transport system permease component